VAATSHSCHATKTVPETAIRPTLPQPAPQVRHATALTHTFPLVSAAHGSPLRCRVRRFESWRITGTNNGAFGTKPDGKPIEMTGTAIWAVRDDRMLLCNRVERNAFEVYKQLTAD
jgi:hypothetical protein